MPPAEDRHVATIDVVMTSPSFHQFPTGMSSAGVEVTSPAAAPPVHRRAAGPHWSLVALTTPESGAICLLDDRIRST